MNLYSTTIMSLHSTTIYDCVTLVETRHALSKTWQITTKIRWKFCCNSTKIRLKLDGYSFRCGFETRHALSLRVGIILTVADM